MVQKYQSPVRVYKHPFELVMAVSVFTCRRCQPSAFCMPSVQSWAVLVVMLRRESQAEISQYVVTHEHVPSVVHL